MIIRKQPRNGVDQYTKLLITSNNADGATAFTDISGREHTVSAVGDIHHETDKIWYGKSSIYCDGNDDNLEIPYNADWDLGGGDFTLDLFANFSASKESGLISHWSASPNYGWLFYWTGSALFFQWSTTGTDAGNFQSRSFGADLGTWYHIEVSRNGNDLRFFYNGTQLGTTATISATIYNPSQPLRIGRYITTGGDGSSDLQGYIDNVRVRKGVGGHTANFKPPVRQYTGP